MMAVQPDANDSTDNLRATPSPDRVVVINDQSAMRGGATGIALASLELLSAKGVPVTFIAGDDGTVADHRSRAVEFVPLGGRHILEQRTLDATRNGLYNASAERQIARWIRANDTPQTIYHLHGWSKILSPSVFRSLRAVAPRVVISAHDFFLVCPNGGYFNFQAERPCSLTPMGARCLVTACDRRNYGHKVWRWIRQAIQQALWDLGEVGAVVAVHEGMLDHLQHGGVPRHKLCAVRNPVVPWRTTRVRAESNRTFFFVGRLDHDKGIDLLAAAAEKVGVPLRVIGSGPLATTLAREFPAVEQMGWRTRAEIGELIDDARVVVMPSRTRETLGLATVEALTSGVPVILSRQSMIAAEVANTGYGLVCDPHDQDMMVSALAQLARDDVLVGRMSRRAYAEAWRLAGTPTKWTADLLDIYRAVLQRGAA